MVQWEYLYHRPQGQWWQRQATNVGPNVLATDLKNNQHANQVEESQRVGQDKCQKSPWLCNGLKPFLWLIHELHSPL